MTIEGLEMALRYRRTCILYYHGMAITVGQWTGRLPFEGHTCSLPTISGASVLRVPGSRSVVGTSQKQWNKHLWKVSKLNLTSVILLQKVHSNLKIFLKSHTCYLMIWSAKAR